MTYMVIKVKIPWTDHVINIEVIRKMGKARDNKETEVTISWICHIRGEVRCAAVSYAEKQKYRKRNLYLKRTLEQQPTKLTFAVDTESKLPKGIIQKLVILSYVCQIQILRKV